MKKNYELKRAKEIPVFFSTDNNYVPYLVVSIQSLIDTSSAKNMYRIFVLNTGISKENKNIIKSLEKPNVKIGFVDLSGKVKEILSKLTEQLRDYYSPSIYYRIFIASLFPRYKKAVYLDCDITILRDIADFYNHDLKNNLVGGVVDEVVSNSDIFREYVDKAVGVKYNKYFNSGILLMNLEEFRKDKIEQKFVYLLNNYPFSRLCPDQDYLNFLCKDRVLYLERGWDRMTIPDETFDDSKLYLVHYNMFRKPWKYDDVLYDNFFWETAKKTCYYEQLLETRNNYTDVEKKRDYEGAENMLTYAKSVSDDPNNFRRTFERSCEEQRKADQSENNLLSEIVDFIFGEEEPAYAGNL